MSTNDVMSFSTLFEKDKIESLSGIREIVCGMRAFNKDAGHCGEGLVDSKYMYPSTLFIYHKKGLRTCHLKPTDFIKKKCRRFACNAKLCEQFSSVSY